MRPAIASWRSLPHRGRMPHAAERKFEVCFNAITYCHRRCLMDQTEAVSRRLKLRDLQLLETVVRQGHGAAAATYPLSLPCRGVTGLAAGSRFDRALAALAHALRHRSLAGPPSHGAQAWRSSSWPIRRLVSFGSHGECSQAAACHHERAGFANIRIVCYVRSAQTVSNLNSATERRVDLALAEFGWIEKTEHRNSSGSPSTSWLESAANALGREEGSNLRI